MGVPLDPPKVFTSTTAMQSLLVENTKGEEQSDDGMLIGIIVACISVVVVIGLVIGLVCLFRQLKDAKESHFVRDLNKKKKKPKKTRSRTVVVTPALLHNETVHRIELKMSTKKSRRK